MKYVLYYYFSDDPFQEDLPELQPICATDNFMVARDVEVKFCCNLIRWDWS